MIGVFLCDCGTNIAGAIDLDRVASRLEGMPGVVVLRHPFMCSEEGQDTIRTAVLEGDIDRVVVAACSPRHHGDVFRRTVPTLEDGPDGARGSEVPEPTMANIREHCAWVTPDRERATDKAIALVRAAIARAAGSEALGTLSVPVTEAVAVVGGGITGMHSALELSARGVPVHLIEREASLGGTMARLNRTFPTDDCSLCSISPILSDITRSEGITVLPLTEVFSFGGRPGRWTMGLTSTPRHVSVDSCTACGECELSTFEPEAPLLQQEGRQLIDRISIDEGACTSCGACVKVCEASTHGEPALELPEGCEGASELEYDTHRCVGCWDCLEACPENTLARIAVCPVVVPRETDGGLGWRHAIYLPHPHAVPLAYVRDPSTCLAITGEMDCQGCKRVCPADAIVDEGEASLETEIEVGAIVLAAGIQEADLARTEYHQEHPDVITGLQLERLLSPEGPTTGRLLRPSDGRKPESVVFVQCAGSRSNVHNPHCSKVCCSHAIKNANLVRSEWPDVDVTVCYTDIRVSGRDAEEYYDRAREAGVTFLRGNVAEVDVGGDVPIVVTEDTLGGGERVLLEADLVVLSTALLPSPGANRLAELMHVATDPQGFYRPVHPKMRPVDGAAVGVHIAGAVESPKFVQECISEGAAAAQRAGTLASMGSLELPRAYPDLDIDRCIGCGLCITECPFDAIEPTDDGRVSIVEASCRACGKCVAACLSTALDLRQLPLGTLRSEVDAVLDAMRGDKGEEQAGHVVAYACDSCGYNAADLAGARRFAYPSEVLPVWVPCSGRLSIDDLVYPFTRGASGVMVAACLPDQCTFIDGNTSLAERLERARGLLSLSGFDPERLSLVHTSSADASRFQKAADRMAKLARGLGRSSGGGDP